MKIRTGFVSNSSSSSYICITSKENHEKVLASFNEQDRDAFAIFAKLAMEERSLMGKPAVILSYVTGECGSYIYDALADEAEGYKKKYPEAYLAEDVWCVVDQWKTKVKEDKENTLFHREDF